MSNRAHRDPTASLPSSASAPCAQSGPVDVLVVGAGLAGAAAAIEAASAGAGVQVVSAGAAGFAGSSFFPGTWGLGLIAPEDASDAADLAHTICTVGGGMADPMLVDTLVHGIRPAMDWLEELGCRLKRPESDTSAQEDAFIPCFDHKHRLWRGIERTPALAAFREAFRRLGIALAPATELIALERDASGITGAVLFDRATGALRRQQASAVVLAAGGVSGLYTRHLTSTDALASVHGIAQDAGARVVNLEFIQFMPGLVAPKRGIVFNEKSFRYARTRPLLDAAFLAERSTYGPFTSRLAARAVDLAIDAAGPAGLPLTYAFPMRDVPEFVRTFSAWLQESFHISPADELRIAHYAHAANGGIVIDAQGSTGVPGLFAAGEVTGGMHGADRLGGLSSANCLVFGRRAGSAAAAYAQRSSRPVVGTETARDMLLRIWDTRHACPPPTLDASHARKMTLRLQSLMDAHAMVVRTTEGLSAALKGIESLQDEILSVGTHPTDAMGLAATADEGAEHASDEDLARGSRLYAQLMLAHAMVEAMQARTESLGAHYRA